MFVSARDLTVLKLFEPCFLLLKIGVESIEVETEVTCRVRFCDRVCEWTVLYLSTLESDPKEVQCNGIKRVQC